MVVIFLVAFGMAFPPFRFHDFAHVLFPLLSLAGHLALLDEGSEHLMPVPEVKDNLVVCGHRCISQLLIVSLCQLVLEGMLMSTDSGEYRLASFVDEQRMSRLYEKFILEYYAKECPQVKATASQIPWALDDGVGTLLPVMQSDIMLTQGNRVLIIDAKYYTHTMQAQYDVHTLHSNNLYQIFTYVKNKDMEFGDRPHEVSGMLLYARTDELIQPDNTYHMSGNKVSVRTLDLNREFSEIAAQLNAIVDEHFS